jgi:predicted nucleic acid-binding protein
VIVVSDNSVLSCLAEIGELDLLRRLYGKITVTETIRREAMHDGAPEDLRVLFSAGPDWITVVPDDFPYLEETGALDSGEASAITLAWQHRDHCLLILDERRGRKVATALGLQITGTAGLLADAAAAGLIDFEDAFLRLSQTGFRLSTEIVEALRVAHGKRQPPAGG